MQVGEVSFCSSLSFSHQFGVKQGKKWDVKDSFICLLMTAEHGSRSNSSLR